MTAKLDLKNKIINGAMDFWQRGTSFASIANATYFADRFVYQKTGTMVHTTSRSTDVPTAAVGVASILLTPTTAQASLTASDYCHFSQRIEGNVLRTFKGKKMVLTFWVKAVKIGTYCVSLRNNASNKSLIKEYTISAANTWEKKTIRFTHDSTGTWVYDNGIGLRVSFAVATGSTFTTSTVNSWVNGEYYASTNQVNGVDNLANTFQVAEICLVEDNEGQTRTTDFTYAGRDYFEELQLCERYYEKTYNLSVNPGTAVAAGMWENYDSTGTTNGMSFSVWFRNRKRTTPTVTVYSPSGLINNVRSNDGAADRPATYSDQSEYGFRVGFTPSAISRVTQLHYIGDAEL